MNIALMNIALATILVPFAGAILTACLPQQWAKWSCTFFSLLATLGTVLLAYIYLSGGKIDVTVDLIHYGDMALFGLTIDRISTLIAFAVVFLGLLVSIYSTGYLTWVIASTRTKALTATTPCCWYLSVQWPGWYYLPLCWVSCSSLKSPAVVRGD